MDATVRTSVSTGRPLHLNAVAVTKADGRVFVYYCLSPVAWWDRRRRKIRDEAFARLRRDTETDPSVTYTSFVEIREGEHITSKRKQVSPWRP